MRPARRLRGSRTATAEPAAPTSSPGPPGPPQETVDTRALAGRVTRGVNWSAGSRLCAQGVQFAAGLVLARLLTPEDFGLLASVYVIYGFSVLFFELGLGAALVQRTRPTDAEESSVFWVNVLGGVLFTGLLTLAGPAVAAFFEQPQLRWMAPVLGLSFTLSFGVVHAARLQKALRFRRLAMVEVGSTLIGYAATIAAAVAGAGAYALVLGPVVISLVSSTLLVVSTPWRPRHFVSMHALRQLWGFSGGLLGFNVVNYWGRNADNLLIGKFVGAAPLGLYSRAYNLMLLPVHQIWSAARVMYPTLSAIKDDHPRTRRAYLRSVRLVNAVAIPSLLGLAAVAEGLVPLLWGPKWEGTVPLLQILCLAGIPQCLISTTGWIYQSQGCTGLMFRMGVLWSAIGVGLMSLGLMWGVRGVAAGVLVRYWFELPWQLRSAGALIGIRARTVIAGALPVVLVSSVMAGAVYLGPLALDVPRDAPVTVLVQIVTGLAICVIGYLVTDKTLSAELTAVIRRRRGSVAR